MNIVHVNFSFTVGGIDTMLVDIMKYQVVHHQVSLIIINDKVDVSVLKNIHPKVNIYCLRRKEGSVNPFFIIKLNLLIKKLQAKVIHCHNSGVARYLYVNVPRVLTVHDMKYSIKEYGRYDMICAISTAVKNDISSKKAFDNLEVVYNGVDVSKIKSSVKHNKVFKVVVISRLEHDKKGLDIFVNAIKQIVDNVEIPYFKVDIIGEGSSKSYLKEYTLNNSLGDRVSFLGNKSRQYIYENLSKYSLLVQPSRYEGFGLTIVEAMCAKIPVLASNIDGPKEILEDGKYGYLFESGNVACLKDKIVDIFHAVDKRDDSIKYNVERSFLRAKNDFNIENTAENYLKVYKRLIFREKLNKV